MICVIEIKEYPNAMDFSSSSGVQFSTTASRALLSMISSSPTAGTVFHGAGSRLKLSLPGASVF